MLKKYLCKNIYNKKKMFLSKLVWRENIQIPPISFLDVNFENQMLFIIQIECYFCSKI